MKDNQYKRQLTAGERLFTRSPFSIVTMVVRITGHVSEAMLESAVKKAQRRHTLLRVRIVDDADHRQWFTSEGVKSIPIDVVQRESDDDWIGIHAEASKIPFEFDCRPAIRFMLVQSPAESDLIILCHHIICDGLSLAYLARDLMVYLGNPEQEVEILSGPLPISLENLPADVSQSRLRRFFINRLNRKWVEEGVYFDNEDYRALTETYWDNYPHQLFTIELTEQQTTALVANCKREKVTVNTAITAAVSGAQRVVQGDQAYLARTVIATSLRNQLPNPPGQGMGFYAAGIELRLKYDPRASFWQNARHYQEKIKPNFTNKKMFAQFVDWLYLEPTYLEAINFKKVGGLVPPDSPRYDKLSAFGERDDVVLSLLKRDKMETPEITFMGPAVTNLGRMRFPTTYGSLELDRLIMQPGGAFPLAHVNLVLGAVTCSGKMSLVFEYAEQAIDCQTMMAVKDQTLAYLLGD